MDKAQPQSYPSDRHAAANIADVAAPFYAKTIAGMVNARMANVGMINVGMINVEMPAVHVDYTHLRQAPATHPHPMPHYWPHKRQTERPEPAPSI